jgi:hypothetical protein
MVLGRDDVSSKSHLGLRRPPSLLDSCDLNATPKETLLGLSVSKHILQSDCEGGISNNTCHAKAKKILRLHDTIEQGIEIIVLAPAIWTIVQILLSFFHHIFHARGLRST